MNLEQARKAQQLNAAGVSSQRIAGKLGTTVTEAKELITAGWVLLLQKRLGVPEDGRPWSVTMGKVFDLIDAAECPPTLPDGSSSVITSPAAMTRWERALDWCLGEAAQHGNNRVPDERVAEYFAGCTRGGENIGNWLAGEEVKPGVDYSFCAAAQGFAEFRSSLPGEDLPPWRAGALEIKHDAESGARPGEVWLPLAELLDSDEVPPPGSVAVYLNTQATGRGHVERVIEADRTGYRSVGANENNRRWVVDATPIRYSQAGKTDGVQRLRLLGFVVPA